MVPSAYALQTVTARLIERLEGARRTFGDQADDARDAFEQTALKHIDAAVSEYEAVAMEPPGAHATFLRQEILHTALPRYHRLAMRMNRSEAAGFGFGWLADPAGRFVLLAVALAVSMVLMRIGGAFGWPLILATLTLPLWPSVAATLVQRRYVHDVQEIVADMERIQAAERAYLQTDELRAAQELAAEPPPRPPQKPEREQP